MRKTKKRRLAAMEGKHHDAKPRYSRKGRQDTEPTEADVFNRRLLAKARAKDPAAVALIEAFANYGEK